MLSELLEKASLFHILHRIDTDLCKKLHQKGCPHCGGPLHQANYERKPRGGPKNIPDEYLIRQSLCCGRPECRRRALPQSCLFMGRRVYWGCVILVVITLKQNRPHSASARRIQEMFGISRQTLKRWIEYFRDEFPESMQWQRLRGRLASTVSNNKLPAELVHYFLKNFQSPQQALIGCLQFLASEPIGSHTS
jgi:hypothetical protein